jgi:TRAP transporter TAXI family solute receptor
MLGGASLRTVMAIAATALAITCTRDRVSDVRTSITIATGGAGGAFYPVALELVQVYSKNLPGVTAQLQLGDSGANVQAVQDGRAQLAFAQADIAYIAYRRGTDADRRPFSNLRGIAVLWENTVQIAVPNDSPIHTVGDLRGRRVAVGTPGSGTEVLARIVLKSYGLHYKDIHPVFISFVEMVEQMRSRVIDAAFTVASVPTLVIQQMSINPGIRLIPVARDRIDTVRGQYPFLRPIVVPRGSYDAEERDVATIGVEDLLLCREDLKEDLVYSLTKAFFEALPDLAKTNAAVRSIDLDQAPGTAIPLHPGAARYYRERQIVQ